MNKLEVEDFLKSHNFHPFYSDNYWIKGSESDYSGRTLAESYCRAKYGDNNYTFDQIVEVEYQLNKDKKLYIIGKTYNSKEDLKKLFSAKWDKDQKSWYVSSDKIRDSRFHDYCYEKTRRFKFKWEKYE